MESILASIKKLLGITQECEDFDSDLIVHINSVFMVLTQLGVGPSEGFIIEDDSSTWDEFFVDTIQMQAVKSYIFMKVKLLFDPPTSSAVTDSYNRLINEFEWRLKVAAESNVTM